MKQTEIMQDLIEYNEWRRGGEGEQPCPTSLGLTIDGALKLLTVQNEKIDLLCAAAEGSNIAFQSVVEDKDLLEQKLVDLDMNYKSSLIQIRSQLQTIDAMNKRLSSEWQPIDTAPRTELYLGVIYSGEPFTAFFNGEEHVCQFQTESVPHKPTHWMPLPQPPERERTC